MQGSVEIYPYTLQHLAQLSVLLLRLPSPSFHPHVPYVLVISYASVSLQKPQYPATTSSSAAFDIIENILRRDAETNSCPRIHSLFIQLYMQVLVQSQTVGPFHFRSEARLIRTSRPISHPAAGHQPMRTPFSNQSCLQEVLAAERPL